MVAPPARPPSHPSEDAISPQPDRAQASFARCAWEAGRPRTHRLGQDLEELVPSTRSGAEALTSSSGSHGPSPEVHHQARTVAPTPPPRIGRCAQPAPAPPHPSGPHPEPNSIAPGLMNSSALIGSPSALWIYTCRLLSRCRRAPPRWLPKARASGLARGSGRGGQGSSSPGRGVAGAGTQDRADRVLRPRPGPAEPGAYLPAPDSPELPGRAAQSGLPVPEPRPRLKPLPRSEMPAGEGRPEPCARFPLSLWIPLIRGLFAAPRLQGCQGRPAGVLETVPSLSPFIKRPGAALKPRSQ
ncbi:unnamed protein product [Rangifer tarandus platyrhynchus]|uniref:Uncharacterized protein n=2 Tax=Rangifer tarandus platyrhynchus TaxID=3082113 RepID=A0AC59Z0P6_RANTA|nr:unnamed protein product [Rangifer tarandus platyrhynchus]